MGLDMYLSKHTYVKNWDFMGPEALHEITITKGGKPHATINTEKISYIVEQVGYWRKANAIHVWFVENCQGGIDECQQTYVPREKLKDLLTAVNAVLEQSVMSKGDIHVGTTYKGGTQTENYEEGLVMLNPEMAEGLLPAQSGFFFGGTDYDEYYIASLEHTREILIDALLSEDGDFYYQSSW